MNGCLAADLFHMFTQSIKFYSFYHHMLYMTYYMLHIIIYERVQMLIHQMDSKNEWLLLSASFTVKCELVFVLTLENAFS